jgi:hypothetical protein
VSSAIFSMSSASAFMPRPRSTTVAVSPLAMSRHQAEA